MAMSIRSAGSPGLFIFYFLLRDVSRNKNKNLIYLFYNRKDLAFDSSPGYIGPN
jgi:hypothetical protein